MAVPKRKKSYSKTKIRRNFWSKITPLSYNLCEACNKAIDIKTQRCHRCKIKL